MVELSAVPAEQNARRSAFDALLRAVDLPVRRTGTYGLRDLLHERGTECPHRLGAGEIERSVKRDAIELRRDEPAWQVEACTAALQVWDEHGGLIRCRRHARYRKQEIGGGRLHDDADRTCIPAGFLPIIGLARPKIVELHNVTGIEHRPSSAVTGQDRSLARP